MISDFLLIQKIRNGDNRAGNEFVKKYYPLIYQYCFLHIHDRDCAEDMAQEMVGSDGLERFMNRPLPHNGQAYIQRDYKTGKDYVMCPYCAKKQFPLTPGAHITGQKFKCKGSGCKQIFEVNV